MTGHLQFGLDTIRLEANHVTVNTSSSLETNAGGLGMSQKEYET